MNNTLIELSEEDFGALFPLLPNRLNRGAPWSTRDSDGCLFETHGPELDFVRRQDPRAVWTLVDGDDGGQFLRSGLRRVNRVGHLVSTRPLPEGIDVEVRLDSDSGERGRP